MILYSPSITARLRYTCGFIGDELGEPIELTESKEQFLKAASPRFNYSDAHITGEDLWLPPHTLLFETGISQQYIECFKENGNTVFFKTGGDISFDIFAAVFYLLSRYEEYLPHETDIYGRYSHVNSLAYKEQFLDKPLINLWLQDFKKELKKRISSFTIHNSPFTFIPTYDIDEAFSFRSKEWTRNTGAALKDLLKGNWQRFLLRRAVRKNTIKDPFDSYEWIDTLHQRYKLHPHYFFLLAENTGPYDRNISPREPALQKIIKDHVAKYPVGIHPSWQSGDSPPLLAKEKEILSSVTGKEIHSSRQHFIRFELPGTFRRLIAAGIEADYSMGYGTINGFRASVASPFYWYDLEKEEQSSLRLFPFCYMEANSFYEQKNTQQEALDELLSYYNEVKAVNGMMITIWHNTFLGTDPKFKGWREVYEQFIRQTH